MDFLRKLFPQTYFANMASDSNENNNIATTIETCIDQCQSQVDNNSNKLETESSDDTTNNDSTVVIIDEFGVTKTFHNLENVTPTELIPTVTDLISNAAEASPVNVPEDVLVINNNDLKGIQITFEANASYDDTTLNDVINDTTMENLEDFEEALSSLHKTALTDDVEIDLINLDEFMEIFDELNPVSEELIAKISSENSIYGNNENATDSKEKEIADATNEGHPILNKNIDVISISSTGDELSQTGQIKDTVPIYKDSNQINKNIDVISISSTGDELSQTGQIKDTVPIYEVSDQSDSKDGFNSSDFEFISETEASMTGFVTNYGLDNCQNLSPASSEPLINYCGYFNREVEREPSDSGEGPSRRNRPRNEFEDRSYRNYHHIPEGDDYLGLFQGIYNPLLPLSEIYFLENKSVRASAMNSQYDGIGFDKQLALRRHQPDSSEDEFEDEAKESAKKILIMYPGENKKRKRRRYF